MRCPLMREIPLEQPGPLPWAPSERLCRTFLRAGPRSSEEAGVGIHTRLSPWRGQMAGLLVVYRVMIN